MGQTPQNWEAEAKAKAAALNIDRVVRVIAFSGQLDEAGINASRTFDGKDYDATSGAGTNTARVRLAENHSYYLYRASDHGRHIDVFRDGAWVKRAVKEAERIEAQQRADADAKDMRRAEQTKENFAPYDDE